MTSAHASTADAVPGSAFPPGRPIWPDYASSPLTGTARWDVGSLIDRVSSNDREIDLSTVPVGYRGAIHDILVAHANPMSTTVTSAGVVLKGTGMAPSSASSIFNPLRIIANWGARQGLTDFSDWQQADAERLLNDAVSGEHRDDGFGLKAGTVRGLARKLRLPWELRALLERPLTFRPWAGTSATIVAGYERPTENVTAPLPWTAWAPLVAGAWVFVRDFSIDILTAVAARRALPSRPRGLSGASAAREVRGWANRGGVLPLHTEEGRDSGGLRGAPNVTLLCRMLGMYDLNFRRPSSRWYAEMQALIKEARDDPSRAVHGGLHIPTVTVSIGGVEHPWIDELGLAETEHLESVLRAACFVLIAALTGMRDGEIQQLERDAATTSDGLPALRSWQFKGRGGVAQARTWWAPNPAVKACEVLRKLSVHPDYLLARSADNAGAYSSERDIARLVGFINADPSERMGRGHGLGLDRIDLPDGSSINATTLRRSFCVFAVTHPGAELGLGIQLGHSALRVTTGYILDGQQQAVSMMNEERRELMRQSARELLTSTSPVGGSASADVVMMRSQVIEDEARLERLTAQLGERLHHGVANDCVFDPEIAMCGPDGPHLADHLCVGPDCGNALLQPVHALVIRDTIATIDHALGGAVRNDVLRAQLARNRAGLMLSLRSVETRGDLSTDA